MVRRLRVVFFSHDSIDLPMRLKQRKAEVDPIRLISRGNDEIYTLHTKIILSINISILFSK